MTFSGGIRGVIVTLLLSTTAACARLHRNVVVDEWTATLAGAQARAASGEFATADSLLARYALAHPGTPATLETAYWRALFTMDPSNPNTSMEATLIGLDGYLRDPRPREHVIEARTLRRTAAQIDGLNRAAEAASAQAKDATSAANTAKAQVADVKADAKNADASASAAAADKDAEIKRLKDELAKANSELDRIRKRLAPPPPSNRNPPSVQPTRNSSSDRA